MTWGELLAQLDVVRAEIAEGKLIVDSITVGHLQNLRVNLRVQHGKEMAAQIVGNDPIAEEIREAIKDYYKEPEPMQAAPLDDVFACLPQEEKPLPAGSRKMAASSFEGATLAILPRETPLIVREPVLEDADESTVGK